MLFSACKRENGLDLKSWTILPRLQLWLKNRLKTLFARLSTLREKCTVIMHGVKISNDRPDVHQNYINSSWAAPIKSTSNLSGLLCFERPHHPTHTAKDVKVIWRWKCQLWWRSNETPSHPRVEMESGLIGFPCQPSLTRGRELNKGRMSLARRRSKPLFSNLQKGKKNQKGLQHLFTTRAGTTARWNRKPCRLRVWEFYTRGSPPLMKADCWVLLRRAASTIGIYRT